MTRRARVRRISPIAEAQCRIDDLIEREKAELDHFMELERSLVMPNDENAIVAPKRRSVVQKLPRSGLVH